ncbi:MAG: PAS domain S-box protein [Anaerolineales bacterium]|nr:PAS domain S-box protein [Anaerolineales bacterium]
MSAFEHLPSLLELEGYVGIGILEQISDVFFAHDTDWQFTYVNKKAAEFFNKSPDELLGKNVFDELAGEINAEFKSSCLHAIETQEKTLLEEFLPSHHKWIEYHIYPSPQGISVIIQDITQRKQSELSLKDSEQQYRRIISTSDEGIWILDSQFNTFYVNNRLAEMFGYQPEEMIGHQVEDFLFPEDRKDHKLRMKNRAKGIKERYDRRFKRKDGSSLWVIISATPITDESGVFQGSFAMFTDITDRKYAEQALIEKEKLLSFMSHVAKIGAWEFDPLTLKGTWTEETAKIHDLDPDDETNVEKGLSFYLGEHRLKIEKAVNDAINKAKPFDLELELISAKGKHKWVRTIGNPIVENDRVIRVQGTFHDISKSKIAEQAIEQSNLFLNNIIEQSPLAMWISDAKGTLIQTNPALCKLLNITPDEVIGKYNIFKDNIVKEQNLFPAIRSVYKNGTLARFALRYDSSELESIQVISPSSVILDVTIFPIKDIHGQITNAVIQLTNITERKIAEDALRQSEFKFRKFVEEASVGIVLVDENGQIVEWNRALQEITGITRDEALYRPIWDVQFSSYLDERRTPERLQEVKSITQTMLLSGEASSLSQTLEASIKHTNGEVHHIQQVVFPIRVGDRYWLGVILRDISKRKQAEEGLRQSEDKFFKAFQSSPNMIAITRLSDGQIIEVNDIFVDHTRHARKDIIGQTPKDLDIWVDQEQLRAYLATLKEHHRVREMEVRLKDKSGNILDCLLSGDIISLNNEPCILSTILDITERKCQEEQIERQLQRLATLRSIDIAITSSFDLRVTLGILLDHVTTQLDVDAAAVLTLNPHMNSLQFAAHRGFRNNGFAHRVIHLSEDPAGQAILSRHLVSIPDIKKAVPPLAISKSNSGENFAACFIAPLIVKGQVKGVLEVFHRTPLHPNQEWLGFLETIAGQTAIAVDNAELFQGLQRSNAELIMAYNETLEGWSTALEMRDRETEGHSRRVVDLTMRLAQAMGIGEAELVHIRRGALLHDIGKMGVPDSILLKPGTLTEEEWQIKQKHPEYAYQMLSPIAYLRPALDIPYYHHEKWDGTGYPLGLKGEQIPLPARIFALADVWDALRSDRPYRPAWTNDEALKYIREQSGIHFDPEVVKAFLKLYPLLEENHQ